MFPIFLPIYFSADFRTWETIVFAYGCIRGLLQTGYEQKLESAEKWGLKKWDRNFSPTYSAPLFFCHLGAVRV